MTIVRPETCPGLYISSWHSVAELLENFPGILGSFTTWWMGLERSFLGFWHLWPPDLSWAPWWPWAPDSWTFGNFPWVPWCLHLGAEPQKNCLRLLGSYGCLVVISRETYPGLSITVGWLLQRHLRHLDEVIHLLNCPKTLSLLWVLRLQPYKRGTHLSMLLNQMSSGDSCHWIAMPVNKSWGPGPKHSSQIRWP